jgi:hypothetical protein
MKTFSLLQLILGFCGGLLIGFVAGGIAGRGAGEELARANAEQTAPVQTELADTSNTVAKKEEPKGSATKPAKPAEPVKKATVPAAKPATKPATKPEATKASTSPAAKPTTKAPAPKPTTAKADEKATTASSPSKAPAAPKGTPPFNLGEEAKSNFFYSVPTFSNGLEDVTVNLEDLKPWGGTPRDYAGTYNGSLDRELTKVRIVPMATGRVNVILTYSIEEYGNDGLAVEKTGDETAKNVGITSSTAAWKKTGRAFATRGQFVTWMQGGKPALGILVHGEHPSNPYQLLRKTGK